MGVVLCVDACCGDVVVYVRVCVRSYVCMCVRLGKCVRALCVHHRARVLCVGSVCVPVWLCVAWCWSVVVVLCRRVVGYVSAGVGLLCDGWGGVL